MKTQIRLITPKEAEKLLEKNTMNRLLKKSILFEYTRQMNNGLWKEDTGEAIKIATDGTVLDGQHRLFAVIRSGKPQRFLIIEDMEKDVFPVLDSGAKRTPGDVLFIGGVNSGRNIAGGIRAYYNLRVGKTLIGGMGLTGSEVFSLYRKRPEFWDASYTMSSGWHKGSGRILTIGEMIGYHSYFYDISQDDAFTFMSSLAEGTNLNKANPIYVLREKLTFAKISINFKLILTVKTALVLKAWNAFRAGKEIRHLSYNPVKEKYPIAK